MYITLDIGGTKTLIAAVNNNGEIVEEAKFPTPNKYDHWLLELRNAAAHMEHKEYKAGGIACPGTIDRQHGRIVEQPNLPWLNEPLQADCEKVFKCPVIIENDANLAALSEAMLHPDYERVLYVTISTGIGTGVVFKQRLDPGMLNSEGGQVLLEHKGRYTTWEKLSAGRMLFKHFGKRVGDIPADDTAAWKYIVRHLTLGLFTNIAVTQPQLVIIGGSIGTYFERYGKLLQSELDKHRIPVVPIPKVVAAQRPERCVTYGCYELAKQTYGHAD